MDLYQQREALKELHSRLAPQSWIPVALQDETSLHTIASFKSRPFPGRELQTWARFPGDKNRVCIICPPGKRMRLNNPLPDWDLSAVRQPLTLKVNKIFIEGGSSSTDAEIPWVRGCGAGVGLGRWFLISTSTLLCHITCEYLFAFKSVRVHTALINDNQCWSLDSICISDFSPSP